MSENLLSHDLATSPTVQDKMVDTKTEEEKCRSVFPEEIWLQIADKADFGAYWQLRESSPYFWDLLENAWNRWFPQFAGILYKQLRDFPKDRRHVMSKCRMVCRRWEKSVDAVIQHLPDPLHSLRYHWKNYHAIQIKSPFEVQLHDFRGSDNSIREFRQHFAETHAGTNRNPFMCRNVFIKPEALFEQANNLTEQFWELLRDYGQHIWHCVIYIVADERRTGSYCRKLFEILALMPNLQTLSLTLYFNGSENNLQVFLNTHPFPTLKHLKSLKVSSAPTCLFNALTRANPKISELAYFGHGPVSFISNNDNLLLLQDFYTTLYNEQQFRMLKNLSSVWSFRKLYLEIGQRIPTRDLFDFMKTRWSATLTTLTLDFTNRAEPLDMAMLNLENLRLFTLATKCYTPPLDFLLPTKSSLESLSVLVVHGRLPDIQDRIQAAIAAERTVKFLDCRYNLIESNIWSFFPKLQSVDFKDFEVAGRPKTHECRRCDWAFKRRYKV